MSDALPYYSSIFRNLSLENIENANVICEFIVTEINNQNIKISTKITHVKILCWFSKYLNHKNFDSVTRGDVSDYLNSLKKEESTNPTHKWSGTYNTRQMILSKFFRWLYNKDEFDESKWITPPCMQGLRQLPPIGGLILEKFALKLLYLGKKPVVVFGLHYLYQ
jgi:site-specific recombinase XerD